VRWGPGSEVEPENHHDEEQEDRPPKEVALFPVDLRTITTNARAFKFLDLLLEIVDPLGA
jgi:hypothetical protein